MKNKKNIIMFSLCIAVLFMAVVFAALQTRLTITGVGSITGNWDIQITNIKSTASGTAYDIELPQYSGTTATFNTGLKKPGDKMVYTITVENKGTINAIIDEVKIIKSANIHTTYTVTDLKQDVRLSKGGKIEFNIEVEFNKDMTFIPEDGAGEVEVSIICIQDDGQIITESDPIIDFVNQENTLAYKVLNENTAQPDTNIDFSQTSSDTNGKGLYYTSTNTEDNKTTYYFRGDVTNNYVKFGGFYWRIVRVNEDGSVRMIYQGTSADATGEETALEEYVPFNQNSNDNAYVGYMYGTPNSTTYTETHKNITDSTIKTYIDKWYEQNLKSYSSYLADAGFCNDRSVSSGTGHGINGTYYSSYNRLVQNKKPKFKCLYANDLFTTSSSTKGNKALAYPIGLITADEIAYAGGVAYTENTSYYLYTGAEVWTMTPASSDGSAYNWYLDFDGSTWGDTYVEDGGALVARPVINLKGYVEATGTGTQADPYVINTEVTNDKLLTNAILSDNKAQSDTNIDFSQISSDTNGKGLYYTNKNTENNQTTYYFRGAVDNNFVKFGSVKEMCSYNGVEALVYSESDGGYFEIGDSSTCTSTNVCKINDWFYQIDRYYVGYDETTCVEHGGTYLSDTATYNSKQDLYWRIVRINEDGSVRLIYNGTSTAATGSDTAIGAVAYNSTSTENAYVGYMYGTAGSTDYEETHKNTNSSSIKSYLDFWYETVLQDDYSSYLADAGFCNDRSLNTSGIYGTSPGYGTEITYYGAHYRTHYVNQPYFACPQTNDLFTTSTSVKGNKSLAYPIGLLTADELVYAGGIYSASNTSYYLYSGSSYWTLSPLFYMNAANMAVLNYNGGYTYASASYFDDTFANTIDVRPVINLKSVTKITGGDGTASNPYVVKTN